MLAPLLTTRLPDPVTSMSQRQLLPPLSAQRKVSPVNAPDAPGSTSEQVAAVPLRPTLLLAEKLPAVPEVAVRPLPTTRLFRTPLVVTPSGEALPAPPTKFTVAPTLRARVVIVSVEPPAPVTGPAAG